MVLTDCFRRFSVSKMRASVTLACDTCTSPRLVSMVHRISPMP